MQTRRILGFVRLCMAQVTGDTAEPAGRHLFSCKAKTVRRLAAYCKVDCHAHIAATIQLLNQSMALLDCRTCKATHGAARGQRASQRPRSGKSCRIAVSMRFPFLSGMPQILLPGGGSGKLSSTSRCVLSSYVSTLGSAYCHKANFGLQMRDQGNDCQHRQASSTC